MAETQPIEIVDVTLRDGLQLLPDVVPTARKIALLDVLARSGVRRLEVGSFVNPKLLPQFADTRAVLAAALTHPHLAASVLVPNRRGFDMAVEAGAGEVLVVMSASEAHNKANINRSVAESLADLAGMLRDAKDAGLRLRLAVATAFHCPFEGAISHEAVFRILDAAMATGALQEAVLADTIGKATPDEVRALMAATRARHPALTLGLHAHDTYGRGVANAIAALEAGAVALDGALAGLGGCPYAPGAAGNVSTGGLVEALDKQGIATGINAGVIAEASALAATFGAPARVPPLPGQE